MVTTRVSTIGFHQESLKYMSKNMSSVNDLNRQISSGQQYKDYAEYSSSGTLELAFSFQSKISEVESYDDTATVLKNRLAHMDSQMETLNVITEEWLSVLGQYGDTTKPQLDLSVIADQFLDRVEASLNSTVGGRYIFSGSKTSTPAVSELKENNSLSADSKATNSYYQGDSEQLNARISETLELTYGVTADNSAFQSLIGSMNLAKAASSQSDADVIRSAGNAFDLADDAKNALIVIHAEIKINSTTVDTQQISNSSIVSYLQTEFSGLNDTDTVAATVLLSQHQATLQASFSSFSKLSSLTLLDYLR